MATTRQGMIAYLRKRYPGKSAAFYTQETSRRLTKQRAVAAPKPMAPIVQPVEPVEKPGSQYEYDPEEAMRTKNEAAGARSDAMSGLLGH